MMARLTPLTVAGLYIGRLVLNSQSTDDRCLTMQNILARNLIVIGIKTLTYFIPVTPCTDALSSICICLHVYY